MKSKTYFLVSAFIFMGLTLGHVLRLLNGWEVRIAGTDIPMGLSWAVLIVGSYLAYSGVKLSK